MPARAALATTLSSWAGTAGLTSTTALTSVIAGGWQVQVASGDLRAGLRQRRRLRRIAYQNPDRHVPLPQQADCL
jgi:hypothetical protein